VSTKPGRTVSNFAVALFATLLTDFYPSTGWNACYVKVSFLSVNQPPNTKSRTPRTPSKRKLTNPYNASSGRFRKQALLHFQTALERLV
ncbi:MAG: hypothetical protein ACFB9N_11825, partial [Geitlerinemataceae cyanobacterium]